MQSINQTNNDRKKSTDTDAMPLLRRGDVGVAVRILQLLLLNGGNAVGVDGVFGDRTEYAVKGFQTREKLLADGIVGRKTWYALSQLPK